MDFDALSQREQEVLELALAGLSAREIAERLTLTEATIRSHLARIYAKSGVSSRIELMAKAKPAASVESPADAPAGEAGSSPRRPGRRRRIAIVAAAIVLAVVGVGALAAFWQPAPPPETTVSHLAEMLAAGRVQTLVRQGDTLFVTTRDAERYRVERIEAQLPEGIWGWVQTVDPRAIGTIDFSVVKPDSGPDWTMALVVLSVVASLAGFVFIVVLALAILRWILRSTPPRRHA